MSKISKMIPRKVVPARSKVAVNKSVQNIIGAKKSATGGTSVADKQTASKVDDVLDKIFAENFEIAVALLTTVAFMRKQFNLQPIFFTSIEYFRFKIRSQMDFGSARLIDT